MAIRKIARMGHPVLRELAVPIPPELVPDPDVQRLIDDMLETVDDASGAGLAAPQVHESVRIVVLELSAERGMEVWINPELTVLNAAGEPASDDEEIELAYTFEGCLSVPGLRGLVGRPAALEVRALRRDGSAFRLQLHGFPAVVAQHECDHLDGVLYVDKVEPRTLCFVEEHRKFGLASAGLEE